jgi:hypothetical protein
MARDEPLRGRREHAADSGPAADGAGPACGSEEPTGAGDPACWAGLVCQDCGAVISEGHTARCSHARSPAGSLRYGS